MNRTRNRPSAGPGWLLPSFAVTFVRPLRFSTFVLVAAALLPAAVAAQDPLDIPPPSDTIYEVGLADGSTFYARITEVDQERVVFTTVGGGRLEVERSQIRSLSQAVGGSKTASSGTRIRLIPGCSSPLPGATWPRGRRTSAPT